MIDKFGSFNQSVDVAKDSVLFIRIDNQHLNNKGNFGNRNQWHIWSTLLLIWVLALILICDMQAFNPFFIKNGEAMSRKEMEIAVSSQLRVAVYYEALCPDSRDFVVKELEPAYKDLHEIIALDLIPYGKATSDVAKDGSKTFHCQHGPKECNANIVHACVSKYVKDKQLSLDVIGCMIDINYRRIDPVKAGEKCVYKSPLQELWPSIEKCSTGDEGKDLLYHMGKMTHDLGTINFIPAITVNDSRSNQNQILRNLKKYLCDTYAGPIIPVACKKL